MRDLSRIFFDLIIVISVCIAIWGRIRHMKLTKKLKQENGTDIINKETVSKETLNELKVSIRLIFIGTSIPIVLGIVRIIWILNLDK